MCSTVALASKAKVIDISVAESESTDNGRIVSKVACTFHRMLLYPNGLR